MYIEVSILHVLISIHLDVAFVCPNVDKDTIVSYDILQLICWVESCLMFRDEFCIGNSFCATSSR